jgi:hypothetical protein
VICLQSEFLRNVYMDFAAREFTAENVKFLIDMVDFANTIDELPPTKVIREAIRIYSMVSKPASRRPVPPWLYAHPQCLQPHFSVVSTSPQTRPCR